MNEDRADPALERAWLRQSNVIYGGLLGVGVIMVQPFLTAPDLELPAFVCVIAFAAAIPLLAALMLVNHQEDFRQRATRSKIVAIARPFALSLSFIGLVAGFWHISWIAGVTLLGSAIVATAVHSAGYVRLEHEEELP